MSYANPEVLAFYKALPFNYHRDPQEAAAAIRRRDPLQAYPPLRALLGPGVRLLDVGCGAGWLVHAAALFHGCDSLGVDFNPTALRRAEAVGLALESPARFERGDLFAWSPGAPREVVTSIGVLHHTDHCLAALEHIAARFVAPGGHLFIGLYHAYGRRPFLEHFRQLRATSADEEALLARYRQLHPLKDETHLRSWFRDQVLHPHETQHTLAEVLPVLDRLGYTLKRTSINGFAPFEDRAALLDLEPSLEARGVEALAANRYYPGFFLFLAQRSREVRS
ncbi:class I SAM-dependent methyltransferase [Myxococcota bacterium]|nr:class I SAM-dependent methyltransferase [Myxococcota bacterium]MBU1430318.1 class I SAM-dependent methyltransferase [Myxococcota bacterium]MBU1900598.1 class I SAM-dependent methyltransferase [Myxococcota bacterium]